MKVSNQWCVLPILQTIISESYLQNKIQEITKKQLGEKKAPHNSQNENCNFISYTV